ncbi:tetratricopeptide repeat protein [uncultured Pseudoteredinibacter sp.]|uniref:tetratricopeptide repeat protein n=1 Tax=uncultured Pseudoteredinibacter sp. TaxID=1641701 RepID=UPI00261E144F|nr:tetratricopeptide repeat protein [uncultured Pseudoteredinibacter sp.]
MKHSKSLDELLADERQCPEEISPKRDLWPGIEKAINQEQQKTPNGLSINSKIAFSSAASVLAAVLLIKGPDLLPSQEPTIDSGITALVDTYEQEKQQMLVRYQGQEALVSNWQQQLNDLEEAAKSLKNALEDDPDNAVLIHMLGNVYQQQLDLINKVHTPKWQQI